MKKTLKAAFVATLPVMTGYLVLGFGFGLVLMEAGGSVPLALAMSAFIYAGSMQYVAIDLLTGGASLMAAALMTLMVNARHLFYGVSMLGRYRDAGPAKPYLIFALTDETYSLVCQDPLPAPEGKEHLYCLLVSVLDHLWWVLGSVAGAAAGTLIRFSTEGVDFALTALFVTVFTEQWLTAKDHVPALIGVGASAVCLLLFGSGSFLIPAMLVIALSMHDSPLWMTVAVIALVTALLRFLPFVVFGGGRKAPAIIERLSTVLPAAIMGMLVVYCLKGTHFASLEGWVPAVTACAVVVALHAWKRNTLLSIIGGTVLYMVLVQVVF